MLHKNHEQHFIRANKKKIKKYDTHRDMEQRDIIWICITLKSGVK